MKPKMQHQVQPPEIGPSHVARIQRASPEVQQEIQNFLRALDSYPARVAEEPRISFQQHLSSIFAVRNDEGEHDRRDRNPRRH